MISFFLPIRSGSKRVKNKNLKKLPGYRFGLTEIKIKQLNKLRNYLKKKNKKFEFVVSTNCKKTLRFLRDFKWIKLHKRPEKLAKDDSLDDLIKIVPKICSGKYILWTHVTSPFFNHKDYLKFIEIFFKKKFDSAFSADLIKKFIFCPKKKWITHNINKKKWPRTQDLKPLYVANSAVFFAKRQIYENHNNRICKNPLPILSEMNKTFDIDNLNDFNQLIKILKSGKKII